MKEERIYAALVFTGVILFITGIIGLYSYIADTSRFMIKIGVVPLQTKAASRIYKRQCSSCHGVDAEGRAGFSPKLAGQHKEYLESQIRDIRNGRRTNGLSSSMIPAFKKLSDKEIKILTKYLEGLKK